MVKFMAIFEDQIIGKGFLVALFVLGIFAFTTYKVIDADPTSAKEVFVALKEPFGYILAFYVGNRGTGLTAK